MISAVVGAHHARPGIATLAKKAGRSPPKLTVLGHLDIAAAAFLSLSVRGALRLVIAASALSVTADDGLIPIAFTACSIAAWAAEFGRRSAPTLIAQGSLSPPRQSIHASFKRPSEIRPVYWRRADDLQIGVEHPCRYLVGWGMPDQTDIAFSVATQPFGVPARNWPEVGGCKEVEIGVEYPYGRAAISIGPHQIGIAGASDRNQKIRRPAIIRPVHN